jgi:hypothetical protein
MEPELDPSLLSMSRPASLSFAHLLGDSKDSMMPPEGILMRLDSNSSEQQDGRKNKERNNVSKRRILDVAPAGASTICCHHLKM